MAAKNTHRIAHTCEYKSKTNDSNEHQLLSHNLKRIVELATRTYNMKLLVGVSLVERTGMLNVSGYCLWRKRSRKNIRFTLIIQL